MCAKFVVVIAICVLQTISAMPGAFGPGGPGGFGGFGAGGFGPAGFGPPAGAMAIVTFNKQMAVSQSTMKKSVTAAKNEIKVLLDALKTATDSAVTLAPVGDACASTVKLTVDEIDAELLTAFDACDMKLQMKELRFQSLQLKTQMATAKMAKKACKAALDPVACTTDADTKATEDLTSVSDSVMTGVTDISTQHTECLADVKETLTLQIVDATDDLASC